MTIDSIINPHTPTKAELNAALLATLAVAEAIRQAGSVPSGTVYATIMNRVSLDGFEGMVRTLQNAGLVSATGHLLTWTGPHLEAK